MGRKWKDVPQPTLCTGPHEAWAVLTRNWEAANRQRLLLTVREWLLVP